MQDDSAALRQKDARIAVLERQKQRQAEELNLLRSEIGASQIKHKEDIYWMRLECDSVRRDKEAAEDRMSELLRDLREVQNTSAAEITLDEGGNTTFDAPYVNHLQSQLNKSMQTVGILDNQISMVKKSCDEVVKSLKEEIGDVMDDKCRMEMELMNQMATLDNEKRQLEIELKEKEKNTNDNSSHEGGTAVLNTAVNDKEHQVLLKKVEQLQHDKVDLQNQLLDAEHESSDEIVRLEQINTDLRTQVDSLSTELARFEKDGATKAVQELETVSLEKQETMATLERVAVIWNKADDSIQALEQVIDVLKPTNEEQHVTDNGERVLSTLETASLVHGQVKVALLLIELKLRNQLGSLKNEKVRNSASLKNNLDAKLTEKIQEIQQEAMGAMDQVETNLSRQIQQLSLENNNKDDSKKVQTLQESIQVKSKDLKRLRLQNEQLLLQVSQFKSGNSSNMGVSKVVMERLQSEVLTVAQRVKDKNETIERLSSHVKEHKVREAALKKEMKRLLKRHG